MRPELPKRIEVERHGAGAFSIRVDGQEFPWTVTLDGVGTKVTTDGLPAITLSICAEEVSVVDSLNPSAEITPEQLVERVAESRRDKRPSS